MHFDGLWYHQLASDILSAYLKPGSKHVLDILYSMIMTCIYKFKKSNYIIIKQNVV